MIRAGRCPLGVIMLDGKIQVDTLPGRVFLRVRDLPCFEEARDCVCPAD